MVTLFALSFRYMNRIDRKFINWIFESTVLVLLAALVGHALDRLFHTQAQFLGMFLLVAIGVKIWQLVRLYRKSSADSEDADGKTRDDEKGGPPPA